jgi:hypothetical protein
MPSCAYYYAVGNTTLSNMHRWACLLKQQLSITVNRFPSKKNKLPFAAKKWKFAVFLLQQQTEVTVFC